MFPQKLKNLQIFDFFQVFHMSSILNILLYGLEYFSVKTNLSTITIVLVANTCLFFYPLYVQDLLKTEYDFNKFWVMLVFVLLYFLFF